MITLRATYGKSIDLRRAIDQEIGRGALLVKVPPPEGLEFRAKVWLQIVAPSGAWVDLESEVMSLLPGVGVAVTVPAGRVGEVRALLTGEADPEDAGDPVHEVVPEEAEEEAPAAQPAARTTSATNEAAGASDRIRLALHGTREDRAAILRDKNRTLHAFVLKNPSVGLDEVTAWAKNPQMNADFLKLIGERKEWLSRPAIALALARNPKTPGDLAVRALDHVPQDGLRQIAKGIGAPPHVVQAARKKVIAP
ncbi:MAG: hypothetical protein U0359_30480 [Byssovorax sp.]